VQVLMTATGRYANTARLNLDRAGVATDRDGWVLVNRELQTAHPAVYAAGDVVGAPGLASTGIEQVHRAVGNQQTTYPPPTQRPNELQQAQSSRSGRSGVKEAALLIVCLLQHNQAGLVGNRNKRCTCDSPSV
jgi:NADPH-dependent glutamate synthase beta subunit-like oxidoreductase